MHAKAWLRHCSRSCHPRSAARQGWVCPSDIPCSRCPRSWSAADSPNLCTNLKTPGASTRQYFVVHTVSFVFIDVELTTPEGVHWRKSTRKWLFLGPALQGRGASSPAQGQVTHTNHTPMNYKYCLVCACQGMASPLQSKLSPQISCATGLGVPIWYTLFKVSAQLVCSWLP